MYTQQLPGQQWKLPKAHIFISSRCFRNTLVTNMKNSGGAPKSNWILTLLSIQKRTEKEKSQIVLSPYCAALLCAEVLLSAFSVSPVSTHNSCLEQDSGFCLMTVTQPQHKIDKACIIEDRSTQRASDRPLFTCPFKRTSSGSQAKYPC